MSLEDMRKAGIMLDDKQWLTVSFCYCLAAHASWIHHIAHSLFGEYRRCPWNGGSYSSTSSKSPTYGASDTNLEYFAKFTSFEAS